MGKGYVYLVGAGPGDPGLITVKGLECIKKAEVIVYDRLANPRLLHYARPDVELIYAGKSPERHALKQHEINQVLVEKGLEDKIVTRLKGGDPFVFGRGGEEAEALLEHDIPFEVVPGITAGIAAPAYAGIPVTHRGLTSTFGIITGNEDPTKEDSSIDWSKIATGMGTLVFYMGMANLPLIVEKLVENGRPETTPIALIRWGTRPEQETLVGTLADIVNKVKEAKFSNPAIICVGEVVGLRDQLKWFETQPLFGKRIIVTRSRSQASALSEMIEDLGGEPWEFPAIEIVEPDDYQPMDDAINEINTYNWLVFTSVNGVEYFFNRLRFLDRDIRDLQGIKICAIGPKTKEHIVNRGLKCDYIPGEYRAEAIIEGFAKEDMKGQKILLPRADIARKILPEALAQMGAVVNEVTAYKTVMGNAHSEVLKTMLAEKKIQVVTFTSSSTVKNFVSMLNSDNLSELMKDVVVASIGPITSDTARDLGLDVTIEAKDYTIPGLMTAITNYFSK